MKIAKSISFRCAVTFCSSAALALIVLIVAATTAVAQTTVFVPGNASGCFGNPADMCVPFVAALTVSGPGTITVTYVSGTVSDSGEPSIGPNGVPWAMSGAQAPLQQRCGVLVSKIKNLDALIGAFVPQSRAEQAGFSAVDGSKGVAKAGIKPGWLFFIGTGTSLWVSEPGTLFLGINDWVVYDNFGGYNVTVTGP